MMRRIARCVTLLALRWILAYEYKRNGFGVGLCNFLAEWECEASEIAELDNALDSDTMVGWTRQGE